MFSSLKRVWNLPDLRNRILFTLGLLALYRILAHIPLPGINVASIRQLFEGNDVLGLLDLFSGGGLRNFSIVLMGVGPYITSSIIFQLLGMVVPSLEQLQKEGEYGRQKITQYTRLATVPIAILQAYAALAFLKSQSIITGWTSYDFLTMIITAAAGTMLLMWIGELISENGLGNGISLIITVGILASLPASIGNTLRLIGIDYSGGQINFDFFNSQQALIALGFLVFAVIVTAGIVFVTEGERQIPVTYARRVRGTRAVGGVNTHLPLRVTTAGVIPIIFAISIMIFPPLIARFFSQASSEFIRNTALFIDQLFKNNLFYSLSYFLLVVVFTFFYTAVVFQPTQVAENLQKQGGFVPGLRPGSETASFLSKVINRITLAGALFLGLVAVLPFLVQSATQTQTLVLGGTGLLIVVSVIIETMRQFRAQMLMRTYQY